MDPKLASRRILQRTLGVERYLRCFHRYLYFSFKHLRRLRYFRTKFLDLTVTQHHLKAGDVVLDVGANIGFYARVFAEAVGPTGRVFAIEPVTLNRRVLEKVVPSSVATRVEVLAVIASASAGTQTIELTAAGGAFLHGTCHVVEQAAPGTEVETVESTTIDELRRRIGRRISLLKIDVEGHESSVLDGARETLRVDRPFVACEIHDRRLDDVLPLFASVGYNAFVAAPDGALSRLDRARPDWRTQNDYFFQPVEHTEAPH